jgi:hypothetical protein
MNAVFNNVLDAIGEYLGDYCEENYSITLYDVPNEKKVIECLQNKIAVVTKKFKWVVLSPDNNRTNIKILDIDL